MTEKRDKVNVEDIIGLIKTDEPVNSVEEVRKLRGRETKQYEYNVNKNQIEKNGYYFALCNIVDAQKIVRELNEKDRQIKVEKFRVNALAEENTELKNDNKRMVKFIMSKGFSLKDYLEWLKEEVWK